MRSLVFLLILFLAGIAFCFTVNEKPIDFDVGVGVAEVQLPQPQEAVLSVAVIKCPVTYSTYLKQENSKATKHTNKGRNYTAHFGRPTIRML